MEPLPKGSYLSKRGYVLLKTSITKDEIDYLKKELVAKPLQDDKYMFNKIDSTFPIYIETKNKIYIPKMFGIARYGLPEILTPNYIGKDWENTIEFAGNLYPSQKEPVDTLIKSCKEKGGGILQLSTGFGKSICLLYALSQLKKKTIIIVNKIPLMNQWKSEINKFLPGTKVGILQGQKNINVQDCDIIIAMLQSMSKIDYPDSLFDDIAICCTDECHNTGSKSFSKILFKLCSQYTIGLSATPKRSDGCEYVFKYHIGDIVYQSSIKRQGLPPILNIIKIDSTDYKEITSVNKLTGQNQIQFTSMLSELIQMSKRNTLILEIIKDLIYRENRKILVLSDRRNHLQNLKKTLDNDLSITFTYGLFLGQMKLVDLERTKASQVIFATFSAFGEGVSEKDLDTLFLITPKKFIGHLKNLTKNESGKLEQIVGRIFRKDHIEKNPLIIDLFDNFSVYKSQSSQRKTFYKQHFKNLTIQENQINLDENDLITVECIKNITKKSLSKNKQTHDTSFSEVSSQFLNQCLIIE
jgi:hypothetical protein